MECEEAVEIERALDAVAGTRYRDRRPPAVVVALAVGHDDVQAIHRAALEDRDEELLPCGARRGGASEECRREAEAYEGETAVPKKNASGNHVGPLGRTEVRPYVRLYLR